jgi:hypothetical protein
MDSTGQLTGPEVTCSGGDRYQAGDHVVTLAPGPDGRLVTSQRAVIDSVDPSQRALTLVTDDGQYVPLGVDQAGADRLDYGYATTVHRAQGATVDRAHLFADGGGRELAYVAMSRARQSTQVWAVADDLPQAAGDLRQDWSTRRTPTWAIDTALPEVATLNRDRYQALSQDQQARLAAIVHAQEGIGGAAIAGIRLPDRAATLGQAQQARETARQARVDLDTGTGVWADTEAGRTVRDLAQAKAARVRAEQTAQHGDRWRDRHAARKKAGHWAQREAEAQRRWATHVAPQAAQLDREIDRHQTTIERTAARVDQRTSNTTRVIEHGLEHQGHARHLAEQLNNYQNKIDGIPSVAEIRQTATRIQQRQTLAWRPEPPITRLAGPEL